MKLDGLMSEGVILRHSRIHGKGIFALRHFGEGDMVLEIDDSHPVRDRSKLTSDQSKYEIDVFIDKEGKEKVVFAPSPERYINHSCDPNLFVKTDMRSGIRRAYAFRDISEGEEITWDYFVNAWEAWEVPLECNCGSSNCRKILGGNFFTLPNDIQHKWIPILDEPFKKKFADQLGKSSP